MLVKNINWQRLPNDEKEKPHLASSCDFNRGTEFLICRNQQVKFCTDWK